MSAERAAGLRRKLVSPFWFRLFTFTRLPLAWFAGLRVVELGESTCRVAVPYGWRSQNPFRSIYFAALAMAAELSTGALAWLATEETGASVAMLVVKLEAGYGKKADGRTTFTCEQGAEITRAVQEAVATGEPRTVRAKTVGRLADGTEVARFHFTWSFKARAGKPAA